MYTPKHRLTMLSIAAFRALSGADPATVAMACETLRTRGFINYFGLQRFGSGCSSTHRQGLRFLLSFDYVLCLTCCPTAGLLPGHAQKEIFSVRVPASDKANLCNLFP